MSTTKLQFSLRFMALVIVALGVSHAQTPAQLPLLTKSGVGVPPNIMLTLDDSGSMQFQHMPENKFAGGTYATTNPVGSETVRWVQNDYYQRDFLQGTVPGNLSSTNYVLKALRSPDTNSIFYNPEIRYQPWLTNDGVTRLPNSPVNAAYLNPLVRSGAAGTVTDLTATTAVALPVTVNAGSFVVGTTYRIVSRGPFGNRTDYTLIGSPNSTAGTIFTATGAGSGGGTAATNSDWCFANATNYSGIGTGAGQGCEPISGAFTHDPGVYFRLTKTGTTYNSVTDQSKYTGFTINNLAATLYTKYPKRTDCVTVAGYCNRTEERQNFANWFTYYRSRNLLARGSMMEAFGPPGNTFRLGFGRINKGSNSVDGVSTTVIENNTTTYGGGGVRPYTAARKVNLFKWLEDLPASGGTPLVTASQAVGEYFSRTDDRGPWTDDPSTTNTVANNKTCRRSYQILLTDGYWNGANVAVGNQDNEAGSLINGIGTNYTYAATRPYQDATSNTLADVAMKYWKTDLQPDTVNAVRPTGDNISFWQNVTNYTVGLGVRGTLDPAVDLPALSLPAAATGAKFWPAATSGDLTGANIDDLWHAAVNSRGQYFSAKDPQELSAAVATALAGATGTTGATAGVATASTVLSDTNRKYVPTFEPGPWSGDIAANPLDATGQVTAAVWKAAERMPAWNARNVVTWDSGLSTPAGVAFDWTSLSSSNKAALGSVAATYTSQFTDFLRGDHSQEGVAKPFRTRLNAGGAPFILGDFVNSNPVLIKDSFNGMYSNLNLGGANGYSTFLAAKAARTSVLFAGSNDGMLHAFKDTKAATTASALTDGQEIFAYVPRAVYPNLYKLTDKNYGTATMEHQFFVDGPLREADAYVNAPGASTPSWRNYLVGSLGAGGRAVFALDVTNSMSMGPSSVRWEISNADEADLGYVLTPIKVGVLKNGRWVAIFGNGFSSTNGYATLFVVDIENAASSNAVVRAAAVKKLNVDTTGSNGLGGVTIIHDASGQIDTVYAGDLKGRMWKLNYSATASNYFVIDGGAALFTATDTSGTVQPITSSPAVYNHSLGGKMLVFGTGKLFSTADATDASAQSVYGVWDKPSDALTHPLSRSNLQSRTLTAFSGTGGASSTTFYSLSGTAVTWSSQRGWSIDVTGVLPGGRVIYPAQVAGFDTALISTVAPVQGTPAVCDSLSGTGMNLLLPVESGTNPTNHNFNTNGDAGADSSDAFAVGYGTRADGIDAIVRQMGTSGSDGLRDVGGGGGEGDCTGAICSKSGNTCVPSPLCPEPNTCLASIQSATAGFTVCISTGTPPTPPIAGNRQYDRVWRRIINPPIR